MPLVISTTNSTGYDLFAIVDKVDTDGVDVSPALRWDPDTEEFLELDEFSGVSDAYITLEESGTVSGYYEGIVEEIDGAAENVRVTVFYNNMAIGILYNIPLPLVSPEVIMDLTVTEDRN